MTGTISDRNGASRLVPTRPPGRGNRRARAFADQIRDLQARGYTLDAIREALAEAGVHVSRSTVHREATRSIGTVASVAPVAPVVPVAAVAAQREATPQCNFDVEPTADDVASANEPGQGLPVKGKDIAAAFFEGRMLNELVRNKFGVKEKP